MLSSVVGHLFTVHSASKSQMLLLHHIYTCWYLKTLCLILHFSPLHPFFPLSLVQTTAGPEPWLKHGQRWRGTQDVLRRTRRLWKEGDNETFNTNHHMKHVPRCSPAGLMSSPPQALMETSKYVIRCRRHQPEMWKPPEKNPKNQQTWTKQSLNNMSKFTKTFFLLTQVHPNNFSTNPRCCKWLLHYTCKHYPC